jgi:dTDP-4-dehydrorhamnose reductase
MGRGIVCIGLGGLGKAFQSKGVYTLDKNQVDITDICSLEQMFQRHQPKYVINCAGVIGTIKCIQDPEYTNMVNVGGVSNIVYMCKKHGASLVHMSTFYCGYYNVYTQSKDMAEDIVMSAKIPTYIVRLPWVFGRYTENFVLNILKGKKCGIFPNEKGYLAYDEDICDFVINSLGDTGITSIANDGEVTREEVVDFFNAWDKVNKLQRQTNMPSSIAAPDVKLRHWKDAMEEFINEFRSSKSTS